MQTTIHGINQRLYVNFVFITSSACFAAQSAFTCAQIFCLRKSRKHKYDRFLVLVSPRIYSTVYTVWLPVCHCLQESVCQETLSLYIQTYGEKVMKELKRGCSVNKQQNQSWFYASVSFSLPKFILWKSNIQHCTYCYSMQTWIHLYNVFLVKLRLQLRLWANIRKVFYSFFFFLYVGLD